MRFLTREEILSIPKKVEELENLHQVALFFKVSDRTIDMWIARLRKEGFKVKTKRGRRLIKLR